MDTLLRLVGFNDKELSFYRREIELFAQLIGADKAQCQRAADQLTVNYDLSFDSIRELLKLLLETVLQDLKDRGDSKKTVVQTAIPMPVPVAAVMNDLNPLMKISSAEYLIIYLSGILFNVFQNLCSPGEHSCGRCGLNLSRERLYRNPCYPRPDKIVSCLGYCDEIYKTAETLSLLYGVGHIHLKGLPGLVYEDQKDYLGGGLRCFLTEETGASEEQAGICLGKCNDRMLEITLLLNKANHLAASGGDAYISFNESSLLNLFYLIYLPNHFEKGKEILSSFIRELQQKKRQGKAALKAPFRIGCMHLPFTNPAIDRCFRDTGAAVVVSSFYESSGGGQAEDEFDRCIRSFYGDRAPGDIGAKAQNIDRLIEDYSLDAFLFGQFENDRALGGDQLLIMKKLKHKEKAHFMAMNNWSIMGLQKNTRIESLTALMMERDKFFKER